MERETLQVSLKEVSVADVDRLVSLTNHVSSRPVETMSEHYALS